MFLTVKILTNNIHKLAYAVVVCNVLHLERQYVLGRRVEQEHPCHHGSNLRTNGLKLLSRNNYRNISILYNMSTVKKQIIDN